MAKISNVIARLPENIQRELNEKLAHRDFNDYTALANWLQTQGYEISRSSVFRYAQKYEKRLENVKRTTAAAQWLAENAPDEDDRRSEAVMALLQSELLESLMCVLELDTEELPPIERFNMLANASKQVSGLVSASTRLKEYQNKTQQRAQIAAENIAQTVKKCGLSDETANEIRQQILGIVA
nr:MAG TPA: Protein of unknown function (DUF3486) [Bacteriophage sp.]